VLTCIVRATASQWKTPFLALHSSETPQPISIKFETDEYVGDAIPHAKFGYCMFSGGASLIGEIVTPGVYFLPFFFYFLTILLTCTDRIVRRRNVVNGS